MNQASSFSPASRREPDGPVAGFIGLGSNIGDTTSRLRRAMTEIDRLPKTCVSGRSSLYRSLPMGGVDQPLFVNAVVRIHTRLSPAALLAEMQNIERRFGRTRRLRWGPRTLDLDILVYGDMILEAGRLRVPHPGIPFRTFVLCPLREIAPGLEIPGMGTPASLLGKCRGPAPRRIVAPAGGRDGCCERDPLPA